LKRNAVCSGFDLFINLAEFSAQRARGNSMCLQKLPARFTQPRSAGGADVMRRDLRMVVTTGGKRRRIFKIADRRNSVIVTKRSVVWFCPFLPGLVGRCSRD